MILDEWKDILLLDKSREMSMVAPDSRSLVMFLIPHFMANFWMCGISARVVFGAMVCGRMSSL